jgi:hypothetical protein
MGFGGFIGGILLSAIAVLFAVFGIVVLLGFFKFVPAGYDVPLGLGVIVVAIILFAFGWYSYQSGKPKGTLNVHNQ